MKILYPYRSLRPSLKTQWTHLLTMVNFYHDDGDEPYIYIYMVFHCHLCMAYIIFMIIIYTHHVLAYILYCMYVWVRYKRARLSYWGPHETTFLHTGLYPWSDWSESAGAFGQNKNIGFSSFLFLVPFVYFYWLLYIPYGLDLKL